MPCIAAKKRLQWTAAARLPQVLIVWHSRTGLARHMADAMEAGAVAAAKEMEVPLDVRKLHAREAMAEDLLQADGFLFCCPENLASVSGEMLEVSFHPCPPALPRRSLAFKIVSRCSFIIAPTIMHLHRPRAEPTVMRRLSSPASLTRSRSRRATMARVLRDRPRGFAPAGACEG